MYCPHCSSHVSADANSCQQCGFSAAHLHRKLGSQWVRLQRVTDAAQCLRLEDHRQLEVLLNDFERSFPQLFFAAYLGVLPISLTVSELGFWLLNQGAFETPSLIRRNDFGLLLVIDPSSRKVSLTAGYALEGLFRQDRVLKLLKAAGKDLSRGAFAAAIAKVCDECSRLLRKNGRRKAWTPVGQTGAENLGHLGLEPLRGGHRHASQPMTSPERTSV